MKKLRKDRVIIVCLIFICFVLITIYIISCIGREHKYQGDIQTYTCTYRQDDKIYAFDLKSFEINQQRYVSLNDIYNIMLILDQKTHVYINQNKHIMVYELSHITYFFHYKKDKITYENKVIEMKNYDSHIYISHKNIYINIFFVEKMLFNNEKIIKFKNKNAIILKNA